VTRGRLPQRAGLPGLNGGGAAAAVRAKVTAAFVSNVSKLNILTPPPSCFQTRRPLPTILDNSQTWPASASTRATRLLRRLCHLLNCVSASSLLRHVANWIGLCGVLRPRQHGIGYMGDGFYRSKDPTNSIKVLKEKGM